MGNMSKQTEVQPEGLSLFEKNAVIFTFKKLQSSWLATALASSVFPVPGQTETEVVQLVDQSVKLQTEIYFKGTEV